MWRDGERVYTAVLRRDMVRSMEQGYEAKPLVYAEPTPNSAAEVRALREALLKVDDVTALVLASGADIAMAEIRDIARTAIDQARE